MLLHGRFKHVRLPRTYILYHIVMFRPSCVGVCASHRVLCTVSVAEAACFADSETAETTPLRGWSPLARSD